MESLVLKLLYLGNARESQLASLIFNDDGYALECHCLFATQVSNVWEF